LPSFVYKARPKRTRYDGGGGGVGVEKAPPGLDFKGGVLTVSDILSSPSGRDDPSSYNERNTRFVSI